MIELIQQLEAAILSRNPSLAERLRPGLPIEQIKKDLKRAGVEGAIDPILKLYSWRNGTNLQGESPGLKAGFIPPEIVQLSEDIKRHLLLLGVERDTDFRTYHFIELKMAILYRNGYKKSAQYLERYFPVLWDGSTNWIAVDIGPSGHNKVVMIQKRDAQPLQEGYDSFEQFLKDAVWANENNEPPACIRTPGKPITESPQSHTEPTTKAVAPKTGKIPETENPLVLRVDFSDEAAWRLLCKTLQDPDDEFSPRLDFITDQAFDGLTAAELPSLLSKYSSHTFAFIVDHTALTQLGHPILVIDLHNKPGRTFRVVASAMGSVANNLFVANMDFGEFVKLVDDEGVFRGRS